MIKIVTGFFLAAIISVVSGAQKKTISVDEFSNLTGKDDLGYLSKAIPEQVRTTLGKVKGFRVLEGNFGGVYVVKGSYTGGKSSLKVQIRIVDASSSSVVASQTVKGDLDSILEKVNKAVIALAKSILTEAAEGTSLTFDTQPTGASIYIDESLIGESPIASHAVTPGRHQVRIEKEGYQPLKFLITIKEGESKEIVRSLPPKSANMRESIGFTLLYLVRPFNDNIWAGDGTGGGSIHYQIQVKLFRFGVDTTFLFNQFEPYKYSVPYSTARDSRYYHFLQTGISMHLVPGYDWNSISPYIGFRTGYLHYWDMRKNSDGAQLLRSTGRMYIGPVVGITLLPKSSVSLFIEGRYDFILSGMHRREIQKATLFSGPESSGKKYSANLITIGGGISVNF
ncbi:MAG: PEGA domain-containing protein [Leptospirales bacterium]